MTLVCLNLMLENFGADSTGAGAQGGVMSKMATARAMAIVAPMNNSAIDLPTLSRVSLATSAREQSSSCSDFESARNRPMGIETVRFVSFVSVKRLWGPTKPDASAAKADVSG